MQLYESGEYRETKEWPYAICAGCVVYRLKDGGVEILLLLRKAGDFPKLRDGMIDSYHLPKGHMNIGETLEQTAMRETAEESGCEVQLQTYLGARQNKYTDVGIKRDKTIHYFVGEWQKDLKGMDHEHSGKTWFPLEKAIEMVGDKNPKREDKILNRLKDFLDLTK